MHTAIYGVNYAIAILLDLDVAENKQVALRVHSRSGLTG